MKKLLFPLRLLALVLAMSFFTTLQAQNLDKATLKEWKKKQKKMDTKEFYNIMTEYNRLKRADDMSERQIKSMSKEITAKSKRIAELEEQLNNGGGTSETASNGSSEGTSTEEPSTNSMASGGEDYNQGVVFRVQIGAFRNKDLTKYTDHPRFHSEQDGDGTKKYTIANFRDYWEADLFKKYLREMGVNDAWIVAYRDGQRTDITNVLGKEEIEALKKGEDQNNGSSTTSGGGGGDW